LWARTAQTKWDLPAAYPATNFHTENLTQFAKDVDKASGGKLKITVHANASLFKAPEIKRAVQGGQAQIGEVLLANFPEREADLRRWTACPSSPPAIPMHASCISVQAAMDKLLARAGHEVAVLGALAAPGHLQQARNQLAADLKGIKWRAYSPATRKDRRTGRRSTGQVQAAELSQALATGVVESYMSSGSTGYDSKTYEHIKNWYDTQAWLPKNAVLVNLKAFDALDKPTRTPC
jgi:TRAP-type C4-dicarboxylate transport system substrate-binding protein